MRNCDDLLKIRDVVSRVSHAFQVDTLRLVVNQFFEILWIVAIHKFGGDSQPRKKDLELIVGAAVQVRGADNIVARLAESGKGHELRRLTGRGGNSGFSAFKSCYAFFENIDGRLGNPNRSTLSAFESWGEGEKAHVHDTAIDVTKFLEAKKPRTVRRVIEHVGLIDSINLYHRRRKGHRFLTVVA